MKIKAIKTCAYAALEPHMSQVHLYADKIYSAAAKVDIHVSGIVSFAPEYVIKRALELGFAENFIDAPDDNDPDNGENDDPDADPTKSGNASIDADKSDADKSDADKSDEGVSAESEESDEEESVDDESADDESDEDESDDSAEDEPSPKVVIPTEQTSNAIKPAKRSGVKRRGGGR